MKLKFCSLVTAFIVILLSAQTSLSQPLAQGSCSALKAACRQDAIERRRTCESLPDDVGPCWTNFEKEMDDCSVKSRQCRNGSAKSGAPAAPQPRATKKTKVSP